MQPNPHRAELFTTAYDIAAREAAALWERLAGRRHHDRVALVTDQVWDRGYRLAHQAAYTDVTTAVAATAGDAADAARLDLDPSGWRCLVELRANAGYAVMRHRDQAPPAADRTVTAAIAAAAEAGTDRAWRSVAAVAWNDAVRHGAVAGIITAAAETLQGWRYGVDPHGLRDTTLIEGQPARGWVADLLRQVNGDVATAWAAMGDTAPTPDTAVAGPIRSATTPAQLAAQDNASGADASTAGTVPDRLGRASASTSLPSSLNRRTR